MVFEAKAKLRNVFYGYRIIAVAFIVLFISSGIGLYSFGLFVKPLQESFGWSRAGIMTANTISTIIRGIGGVLAGRLIDRFGPKRVMVIGSIAVGLSLGLVSTISSLWQFYVYYGLAGIGFAGMGFIPVIGLIFRWFRKRRGMAIGLCGVGTGVGSFVLAPLVGGYIIPFLGWRIAFIILGLLPIIIVIPLVLLVVKNGPEVMGLQPDGADSASTETGSDSGRKPTGGLSLGQALKTPAFWLITISGAAFGFAIMGIIQNQVAHLTDIGFSMAIAASAVGVVGISNSLGKFGFGLISDWIKPKYARAIVVVIQIIAVIIMMNLKSISPVGMVWFYAIVMGLGLGGWLPTMSLLVSGSFGLAAFGTIFGIISMINMFGGSTGPLFAGYVFDTTGKYATAFTTFLILYVLSLVATLLIRKPKSMQS